KIRVAGAEQRAHSLWLRKYSEQLRLVRKSQSVEDYVTVFNQAIPTISTILLFWAGVDLLTGGVERAGGQTIGVGTFLAFNLDLLPLARFSKILQAAPWSPSTKRGRQRQMLVLRTTLRTCQWVCTQLSAKAAPTCPAANANGC